MRKYGYFYDGLNRLKNAWYMKPGGANEVSHSYDESLNYDKNGNITNLFRNGMLDSDSAETLTIDLLRYQYAANSNQLTGVADLSLVTNGFNDGANTAAEYVYDAKGNMTSDSNKGIAAITYNQLNLPKKITLGDGISYTYDANGVKLQKNVSQYQMNNQTDYLWGFQYKFGLLEFMTTSEGYLQALQDDDGNDYSNTSSTTPITAIKAEDKVNRNQRSITANPYIDNFKEKSGTITRQAVIPSTTSGTVNVLKK